MKIYEEILHSFAFGGLVQDEQSGKNSPTVHLIGWVKHAFSDEPVDMASGAFVHDRTDLTLGTNAPLGLTFSRSYNSSLNQRKETLGYGWTHKYNIYLEHISHSEPCLGYRQPIDVASIVTALYVSYDMFKNQEDLLTRMSVVLTGKWAVDQLINNAISVHLGSQVMEYVKLTDGTYAPPPGVTTQLIDNGDGTFSLKERFGTRMDFDANDRIIKLTDVDGNVMKFTYNGDNLIRVEDAFGRSLNLTYTNDKLSSVSDSAGSSVSYSYDANGNLTSYIDSDNKVWRYGYDTEHRMTSITNPLSITTVNNTYDSQGRMDSQTVPRQGGTTAVYNFYFSGFRNIEKDPDGNETIYFYDDRGNLIGEENALGHLSLKKFDGQNHVIESTDPRGNKITYVFDGNQNLIRTINARNKATNYTYDTEFRLTDITDSLAHTTHMDYDAEHHLILTRDAETNESRSAYYANGLMETASDCRGTTTTMAYDANGNPKSSRVGSHSPVTYVYDVIGRMTSLTDQAGSTTSFEYNNSGLISKATDSLGRSSSFTYDDAGQLSSTTDRNGNKTTYTYTGTGKLKTITYPGSSIFTFSYDMRDNLVQMQDTLGTTVYTYDTANRLTSITDPHGFSVSYLYDEAGNLTSLTYPGNKIVSYTYDALNRLETVTNWLGQRATYSYDSAGRLVRLVNFNNTVTTYDYDKANRLINLENRKSDGSVISSYHFTLDSNGNRTDVVQDEPLAPNISEGSTNYDYNAEKNRLESAGTTNFTWDNEGQLTTKHGTSFTFDAKHRLVQVSGPSSLQYAYDGKDNQLEAIRNGVSTRYVYDSAGNLLAESDSSNVIMHYYIYGLGLLAMVTPANQTYCYHYNGIGSTIAISNISQTLVNKYSYTPFGKVANEIEAAAQPFKFVGRYGVMSEPNGFYYMRARYYDPKVGRFISEDPMGFEGGLNLYNYVGNNPVNYMDPLGTLGPVLTKAYIIVTEASYWIAEHWDELEQGKDIIEELWERWTEHREKIQDVLEERKEDTGDERKSGSVPPGGSGK